MFSQQTVLDLIDLAYAAGCDPAKWPRMLQSLVTALGGAGADLAVLNLESSSARVHAGVGIVGAEFVAEYQRHLHDDPFLIAARKFSWRPGMVGVGESLVPTSVLESTCFYNEFGRRYDYSGGMTGIIRAGVNGMAAINVCRRPEQRIGDEDVRLIRTLIPHLARALQIHERLVEARTRDGALQEMLDLLTTATVLIERSGRVLFANNSARAVLAEHDGLSVDRGILRAERPRDTTALMTLIGGAAESGAGRGFLSGGVLILGRPSGRRPLQVIVSPLTARCERFDAEFVGAIIFVNDPERMPEPDVTVLRRAHGVSRAQADVARLLLQDRTVQEIAAMLNVTTNTVRFHLKQLFAKTGTRRQSELVRQLLATAQVKPQ